MSNSEQSLVVGEIGAMQSFGFGCWVVGEIGAMQSFGFASNGGGLLVLGYKYVNWIDLNNQYKYKYNTNTI